MTERPGVGVVMVTRQGLVRKEMVLLADGVSAWWGDDRGGVLVGSRWKRLGMVERAMHNGLCYSQQCRTYNNWMDEKWGEWLVCGSDAFV
ncbi:GGDEF domain-containing protein [Sesbania bispinosa]|nr:GGDEF domain-containing protein [Sesbania bispinosa]